jgi:hypothetical protein
LLGKAWRLRVMCQCVRLALAEVARLLLLLLLRWLLVLLVIQCSSHFPTRSRFYSTCAVATASSRLARLDYPSSESEADAGEKEEDTKEALENEMVELEDGKLLDDELMDELMRADEDKRQEDDDLIRALEASLKIDIDDETQQEEFDLLQALQESLDLADHDEVASLDKDSSSSYKKFAKSGDDGSSTSGGKLASHKDGATLATTAVDDHLAEEADELPASEASPKVFNATVSTTGQGESPNKTTQPMQESALDSSRIGEVVDITESDTLPEPCFVPSVIEGLKALTPLTHDEVIEDIADADRVATEAVGEPTPVEPTKLQRKNGDKDDEPLQKKQKQDRDTTQVGLEDMLAKCKRKRVTSPPTAASSSSSSSSSGLPSSSSTSSEATEPPKPEPEVTPDNVLPFGEHPLDADPLIKTYRELMQRECDLHGRAYWLKSDLRRRSIDLMSGREKLARKFT